MYSCYPSPAPYLVSERTDLPWVPEVYFSVASRKASGTQGRTDSAREDSHIKVTGMIVGNFERNLKVPARFQGIHFHPKRYQF